MNVLETGRAASKDYEIEECTSQALRKKSGDDDERKKKKTSAKLLEDAG
jgi:hypothetical protein